MNSEELFKMALGIDLPWGIKSIDFDNEDGNKVLNINVDFTRGSKFKDETGKLCPVHDTVNKTWRHLNFFEHACYIKCRVPRIKNSAGKVTLVTAPWSRAGSGFTLLFEAFVMALIESEMSFNKIGTLLNENAHRIWTVFNYWVKRARAADSPKCPERIGFDETSKRKGHDYITLGVDLDERKVLHIAQGKGIEAIEAVKCHLEDKNIDVDEVKHASIDMSPSFISGIKRYFPEASIHFDRFHVVKLLNEAMDKLVRSERKEHSELKGHKYTFLKNEQNLTSEKRQRRDELITLFPSLGTAYRLKVLFNDVWDMESPEEARQFLLDWCDEVEREKIIHFFPFLKTIKSKMSGIINFGQTRISNGILEGINSKVQLAKRRAKGYRSVENLMNVVYFLCGKLKYDYPLYST